MLLLFLSMMPFVSNNNDAYELIGLPCSSVGKESVGSAGDPDSIPGLGRSSGEINGSPLQ